VLGCTTDHRLRLSSSVLEERTWDAWLGVSADTRFIAASEQGRWRLFDTRTGAIVELDRWHVDRRQAGASGTRSMAFHPERPVLALLLRDDQGPRIRLYALETQHFEDVALEGAELFRLSWEPSGRGLHLETIGEDSNRNGRLDWPEPEAPPSRSVCSSEAARFRAYAPRGDRLTSLLLAAPWLLDLSARGPEPTAPGTITSTPGFLTLTAAHGWLGRSESRLMVTRGTESRPLFADDCDGRVLAVHRPTANVLVRCAFPKRKSELRWVSATTTRVLPVESPYQGSFDRRGLGERFLPLYLGERSLLVDLVLGEVVALEPREQLLLQDAPLFAVRHGNSVVLRGRTAPVPPLLADGIDSRARLILGGAAAWLEPYLVTLKPSPTVRRLAGTVHWLTAGGCALVEQEAAEAGSEGLGALAWSCADEGTALGPLPPPQPPRPG